MPTFNTNKKYTITLIIVNLYNFPLGFAYCKFYKNKLFQNTDLKCFTDFVVPFISSKTCKRFDKTIFLCILLSVMRFMIQNLTKTNLPRCI